MNKQTLQNLLEMATMAIQSGRITKPEELIAAGQAMGQARDLLALMKDHHSLAITEAKPVGEVPSAGKPKDEEIKMPQGE